MRPLTFHGEHAAAVSSPLHAVRFCRQHCELAHLLWSTTDDASRPERCHRLANAFIVYAGSDKLKRACVFASVGVFACSSLSALSRARVGDTDPDTGLALARHCHRFRAVASMQYLSR